MMSHRTSKFKGFTIIELLVVIAVIAVLASILVPAIGRARTTALSSKCVGNLRQMGIAFRLYANENGGYLPKPQKNYLDESRTSASWMVVVGDYMAMQFPKENEDTFFLCPEAQNTYPNGNARRTYGINRSQGGAVRVNLFRFEQPANAVLLFDIISSGSVDGYMDFSTQDYDSRVEWRHNDSTNVLFVDGHVESIHKADQDQLETYVLNFIQ